jgi:hypothetical protein
MDTLGNRDSQCSRGPILKQAPTVDGGITCEAA